MVDQFGYLPVSEKIAVIRIPKTGYDSSSTFTPGKTYALRNTSTGEIVLSVAPTAWNGGATDTSSGDQAYWVDFSSVTKVGNYAVVDVEKNVRSFDFAIGTDVYRDVLKQAVRMLYYQRAGQEKTAANAGTTWADKASHVGPNQDHDCRRFLDKDTASTAKDLWGGWYDAGDLNKYTAWTAGYVMTLLHAYAENPTIWTDDYNIPESGNGIPDLVDEIKWGMDFLVRMQNSDGSVLSIVGEASASPPSAATGPSYYGDASTNATMKTAGAFALGARVLKTVGNAALSTYADGLLGKAKAAWAWAEANPNVIFHNNSSADGTSGLGAGDQETDAAGRRTEKLQAAAYLYAATGDATYKTFFEANYTQTSTIESGWLGPWDPEGNTAILDYATTTPPTGAPSAAVVSDIKSKYLAAAKTDSNLNTVVANNDPYLAYLQTYTWGSNQIKANQGLVSAAIFTYKLEDASNAKAKQAAQRYIHYIHGVNPFNMVYLTNMNDHGAKKSTSQIFHTWFADGTKWDKQPAPGYLPGGPNPSYDVDGCCPSSCGGTGNNAICTSESVSPPKGQPAQKSYKDFNTSWPLDTWSVTEPSDGYQVGYIRLLSKFVQ